jgi:hypothetical protein
MLKLSRFRSSGGLVRSRESQVVAVNIKMIKRSGRQ